MSEQETRIFEPEKPQGPGLQLKPGDLLQDRYQIQEIIGVGGMGTVYRARDTNFKAIRLVAIKEMISQVNDPVIRKNIFTSYERESNILATLRHQSIPRIYDYIIINDRAYLIMEFVNGRNIDEILAETTTFFPESQVIAWAIELCDVLNYLHNHEPEPIIFRDMKPSNVMVNLQNHIVLVDFGIAKLFEGGQKNTMIGTQGYSPPDQYRGEATPMVDIYALGATIHHLLTLRDPRLEAPFSFEERPIKEINNTVSDEMVAVIDRALEYKPEDRFANIAEMKEAMIIVAQKTGALPHLSFQTASVSTPTSGVKALWEFECEDDIRGTPLFHNGTLYTGCYDNNLYAVDASNGEFKWKFATEGGIPGRPAIIDNNIYIGSEDHRVYAISSRTGKMVWSHLTEGPVRSSPRIAQGHVFIGSDDNYLHAINLNTGRPSWKVDVSAPVRSSPFITNDRVYFGTELGELICLDFSGEVKFRFRGKRAITASPAFYNDSIIVSSLDSTLYSIDATSGWVNWRFRLGKGSISSPVIVDDHVIVGATDHVIYCVDNKSAKEVWRFNTEHQVNSSPIIYKNNLYIGSIDGHLYCIDHKSGQLRWKFTTQGPVTGSPIAHEDVIYFGSTDHKIYALLA